MTSTMPRARANTALAAGVPGTRVGYRTTSAPVVAYWPDKGTALARRQIARRPQAILSAWKRAGDWLAVHSPWDTAEFGVVAAFWTELNAHIAPRGEMATFQRYNH